MLTNRDQNICLWKKLRAIRLDRNTDLAAVPIPAPEQCVELLVVVGEKLDQLGRKNCGAAMSSAALEIRLNAPLRARQNRSLVYAGTLALGDSVLCALLFALSARLVDHANAASRVLWDFAPVPMTIALLALMGSYRRLPVKWSREYRTLVTGTALGFAAGATIAALRGAGEDIAARFVLAWLLTLFALLLVRSVCRSFTAKTPSQDTLPVVILGTSTCAHSLYLALAKRERAKGKAEPGVRIAAIFAEGAEEWPEIKGRDIVVGAPQWAKNFVECCAISHGIVAIPAECDLATEELFGKSVEIFRHLFVAPQIARRPTTLATRSMDRRELGLLVGANLDERETGPLKRAFDLVGAITLGLMSLPFILVTALAIWLSSKGPVLYRQVRIGKGNRAFTTLKFRTMYIDAGERLHDYLRKDPSLQAEWASVHKLKEDPRVTVVGRFLRRFSLDELPQLWNVLVGDMSLVGPRPIVIREIEKYGSQYAAYERARPGLTGLWQVSGRNNTTYQERVNYDSFYVRNWSLRLDARIIVRTLRAVLSGAGAY
jgi:Undecaprenyl-phosphate galactose phosphotransferase WbaP